MLSLTNVINIGVSLAPTGLANLNVNNLALFSTDAVPSGWSATQRYGVYVSALAVAADFGSNSETYQQALAVFSQQPNILAGGGSLIIIPFGGASALSTATIAAGGAGYKVGDTLTVFQTGADNTATVTVSSVNSGVITGINVGNVGYGYAVASALATQGGSGTGATINITGVANETMGNALVRASAYVYFNGIISTSYGSNSSWATLAAQVQAYGDKMLFLPSNTVADIAGAFGTIQSSLDYFTRCLYYGGTGLQARLFAAAYASRLLSVNFSGSNTAITMNFKQLSTIAPDETISQTVYNQLQVYGVDSYVDIAGQPGCVSNGANRFADSILNLVWFITALKINGFNLLAGVGTKVPQTESGVGLLKTAYRQVCEQALNNAYIAAGAWTSAETFGNQVDFLNNILARGYYIYSQPVNQQPVNQRQARMAPSIQIAIKEAGAIHSTIVNVSVNQ